MEILDFLFDYFLEHQPIDPKLDLLERQLSPLIPKGNIDLEMTALDYVGRSNYLCFVGGFQLAQKLILGSRGLAERGPQE